MKKGMFFIATLTFVALLLSCSYNKEQLPVPEAVPVDQNLPVITYTSHAKAIIDTKCANCHSSTPLPADYQMTPFLSNYAEVNNQKDRIEVRALVQGSMPEASSSRGLLTQLEKDTIQMWIDQGALE